jgi:hypothetical protein
MDFGPNKDNKHKLRQLLRLERFHQLYENKDLKMKESALSYYLYYTRDIRKEMLNKLQGIRSHHISNYNLNELKTRLAKIPPNNDILGDRGFDRDAWMYPNINCQVTPSFLTGRKQFSKEEIVKDREVCTLRYTAEVLFAHIFNEKSLKDIVRYGLFSSLNDCWDWGNANANLYAPLRNWQAYLDRH